MNAPISNRRAPIVWQLTADRPGPADHDLECAIISAVLTGTVKPQDLAISADDFWADINKLLWPELLAAKDCTDLHALVAASLISGPLLDELETLAWGQPFFLPASVDAACIRVRELAAQRRLIVCMQGLDAEMRIGACDVKGARVRLSQFFRGDK